MEYSKELQNYIKTNLIRSDNRPNVAVLRREWFTTSQEYQNIFKETSWINSLNFNSGIKLRLFLIHENVKDFNKCSHCNGNIPFGERLNKTPKYCSKKCSCNSSIEKRSISSKNRYKALQNDSTLYCIEDTLDYISKKFENPTGSYKREAIYDGFYNSVESYCNLPVNFIAKMYCLKNNITNLPKCQCGKEITSFIDINKGFREYCSNFCSSKFTTNKRQQTYLENTGYTHFRYNPADNSKMIENNLQNWGYEQPQQSPEIKKKIKATKLEIYGDENYNNVEKAKNTNLERYGVTSLLCNQEWKEQKNLEKYGTRFCGSLDWVKEKIKSTNLDKYGVEYYFQTDEYKRKSRQTSLEKYGVEHYAQLGITNGYKWYEYKLPSGKVIKYQGYEDRYIPILLRKYKEDEIVFNSSKVPRIKYTFEGKERYYFPDFYIPKDNLLIEIKSKYTLNSNKEKNKSKFKAVIGSGYNFKLKVYK